MSGCCATYGSHNKKSNSMPHYQVVSALYHSSTLVFLTTCNPFSNIKFQRHFSSENCHQHDLFKNCLHINFAFRVCASCNLPNQQFYGIKAVWLRINTIMMAMDPLCYCVPIVTLIMRFFFSLFSCVSNLSALQEPH